MQIPVELATIISRSSTRAFDAAERSDIPRAARQSENPVRVPYPRGMIEGMGKQLKDTLEFIAALTFIVVAAWIISVIANSAVRLAPSPGQLSEQQIAMICLLVVMSCLASAGILGIVRWMNNRDDSRHAKRPPDPP